jgi:hypothetical protein
MRLSDMDRQQRDAAIHGLVEAAKAGAPETDLRGMAEAIVAGLSSRHVARAKVEAYQRGAEDGAANVYGRLGRSARRRLGGVMLENLVVLGK